MYARLDAPTNELFLQETELGLLLIEWFLMRPIVRMIINFNGHIEAESEAATLRLDSRLAANREIPLLAGMSDTDLMVEEFREPTLFGELIDDDASPAAEPEPSASASASGSAAAGSAAAAAAATDLAIRIETVKGEQGEK